MATFNLDSLSTKLVDFRRYCSTFRDGCGRTGKREQQNITKHPKKHHNDRFTLIQHPTCLEDIVALHLKSLDNIEVPQLPNCYENIWSASYQESHVEIIWLSLISTWIYKWILKSAFELRIPFASAVPLGLASAVIRDFNHPERTNNYKVFYFSFVFAMCNDFLFLLGRQARSLP